MNNNNYNTDEVVCLFVYLLGVCLFVYLLGVCLFVCLFVYLLGICLRQIIQETRNIKLYWNNALIN